MKTGFIFKQLICNNVPSKHINSAVTTMFSFCYKTIDKRFNFNFQSEERGKEELEKHDVRPMARSTGNSLDRLRAAESSPNMEGDGKYFIKLFTSPIAS